MRYGFGTGNREGQIRKLIGNLVNFIFASLNIRWHGQDILTVSCYVTTIKDRGDIVRIFVLAFLGIHDKNLFDLISYLVFHIYFRIELI